MKKEILYVGIDVDDQAFHVTAFLKDTGEVIEDKCKPTVKSLRGPHY